MGNCMQIDRPLVLFELCHDKYMQFFHWPTRAFRASWFSFPFTAIEEVIPSGEEHLSLFSETMRNFYSWQNIMVWVVCLQEGWGFPSAGAVINKRREKRGLSVGSLSKTDKLRLIKITVNRTSFPTTSGFPWKYQYRGRNFYQVNEGFNRYLRHFLNLSLIHTVTCFRHRLFQEG